MPTTNAAAASAAQPVGKNSKVAKYIKEAVYQKLPAHSISLPDQNIFI